VYHLYHTPNYSLINIAMWFWVVGVPCLAFLALSGRKKKKGAK